MEQRLARIEEQVGTLQRERAEDHKDLRFIRESVQRIELTIATFRFCPAPGACLQIQPRVEELEKQAQSIRDKLQQAQGMSTVFRILWLGLASVVGGVITWAVQHFRHP